MLRTLRSFLRVILLAGLCAGVITAAIMWLLPSRYKGEATFFVDARQGPGLQGALAGLALAGGLAGSLSSLTGTNPTQSTPFFVSLLESREVRTRLLTERFTGSQGQAVRILDELVRPMPDSARRMEKALKRLDSRIGVTVDARSGIVDLTVTIEDPVVSAAATNWLVTELDRFNQVNRQSRARARRKFTEARRADAEQILRQAESNLRAFYEANRQYQTSPTLRFEESRLQRQVSVSQEVFLSLARELESARIEEVNDTPTLSMIDHAVVPAKPSGPPRLVNSILAAFFGAALTWIGLHTIGVGIANNRDVPRLFKHLYGHLPRAAVGAG